jgi:hypothetical protein
MEQAVGGLLMGESAEVAFEKAASEFRRLI